MILIDFGATPILGKLQRTNTSAASKAPWALSQRLIFQAVQHGCAAPWGPRDAWDFHWEFHGIQMVPSGYLT